MSVVPGGIETAEQPPMTVPLGHFVVALGFLVFGVVLGVGIALGVTPGNATLAHVHLLLVGWVCVTIMGAVTQFVPVWSGAQLHSQRLSGLQLWLVAPGLGGFVASLLGGWLGLLPAFGAAMVLGFLAFAYNAGRTLRTLSAYDVTERHFGLALAFFVVATPLGLSLAVDFVHPVFGHVPVSRAAVASTHATLAVFGAVLTTVLGALYQLGTMFAQTELDRHDRRLRRIEEIGYPSGVVLIATGRLLGLEPPARLGGLLIVGSLLGFGLLLGRRLHRTRVDWTPMLSRYAVAVPALVLWALLAGPAWVADPLAGTATFGAPGTAHLLTAGVVGFVVLGTLYHVVPFIVWVHRYSDLLGREAVPMVDDLYRSRLAAADFVLIVLGTAALVVEGLVSLPVPVVAFGGACLLAGSLAFVANLLLVIRDHSPHSVGGVLSGTLLISSGRAAEAVESG
jgi:cbb3-type cytochrome oxidase subunit 1